MKHPLTKTALALPFACAIFCATLSGCSRDSAPAPAEPSAPQMRSPEERMKDPEYVKKLNSIRDELQEIAERLAAARKELDAALAEDPESAKAKALQEKFNAVAKELETNRAKAILAVRDGMLSK